MRLHNKLQRKYILQASVELQGTHTRGMLVVDKRVWFPIESKNVEIVELVDIELVKQTMIRAMSWA